MNYSWTQHTRQGRLVMKSQLMLSFYLLALLTTSCKKLDCTNNDPDVQCAPDWTCNAGTRRCEQNCPVLDGGVLNQDLGSNYSLDGSARRCVGGWLRSCLPVPGIDQTRDALPPRSIESEQATCFCRKHADCNSGVCNLFASPGTVGTCEPVWQQHNNGSRRHVIYVDGDRCAAGGDGSPENPYCQINQAIARNAADNYSHPIRVMASNSIYDGFSIKALSVTPLWIVGPDQNESVGGVSLAKIGSPVAIDAPVANADIHVILEGVHIPNNVPSESGIRCTSTQFSTTIELRRVVIGPANGLSSQVAGAALYVKGCGLRMDRSAIINNTGRALILEANDSGRPATSFYVSNSVIANNGLVKSQTSYDANYGCMFSVCLAGKGRFQFNTVVNNGVAGNGKTGIQCAATPYLLENSIVVENPPLATQQFDYSGCSFRDVVVGKKENPPTMMSGLLIEDPAFKNPTRIVPADFVLSAARAASSLATTDSAQKWDFLGANRPDMGASVGAFEFSPLPAK